MREGPRRKEVVREERAVGLIVTAGSWGSTNRPSTPAKFRLTFLFFLVIFVVKHRQATVRGAGSGQVENKYSASIREKGVDAVLPWSERRC